MPAPSRSASGPSGEDSDVDGGELDHLRSEELKSATLARLSALVLVRLCTTTTASAEDPVTLDCAPKEEGIKLVVLKTGTPLAFDAEVEVKGPMGMDEVLLNDVAVVTIGRPEAEPGPAARTREIA